MHSTLQCTEYPQNYTLVVQDDLTALSKSPESIIGDTVSIVVNNLMVNTQYSYYLIANNFLGSHESTRTNISEHASLVILILISLMTITATADLQNVMICKVQNTHYFIQCIYLNGTDVGGCNYTLVAVEGRAENVTGYIERTKDREDIQVMTSNELLYSELVVSSTESLTIRRLLNPSDIEECLTSISMLSKRT